MLSVRQVAETFDTTEAHVRALARRGDLPGVKVGKLWRFDPADVEAVLKPTPPKAQRR